MSTPSPSELTDRIVEKARSLGASVVGIADVEPLKASPSHRIYPKIGMDPEVPWQDAPEEALHHEVEWPADAVSAVVIGVEHPVESAGARLVRRQGDARQPHPHPHHQRALRMARGDVLGQELPAALLHREHRDLLEGLGRAGRPRMHRQEQHGHHARVRPAHPLAGAAPGPHGEGHRPGRVRPLRRLPAAVPQGLPRQGVRPRRLLIPSLGNRSCRASMGPTTG